MKPYEMGEGESYIDGGIFDNFPLKVSAAGHGNILRPALRTFPAEHKPTQCTYISSLTGLRWMEPIDGQAVPLHKDTRGERSRSSEEYLNQGCPSDIPGGTRDEDLKGERRNDRVLRIPGKFGRRGGVSVLHRADEYPAGSWSERPVA